MVGTSVVKELRPIFPFVFLLKTAKKHSSLTFNSSKSTIETLEKGMKYVQS